MLGGSASFRFVIGANHFSPGRPDDSLSCSARAVLLYTPVSSRWLAAATTHTQ